MENAAIVAHRLLVIAELGPRLSQLPTADCVREAIRQVRWVFAGAKASIENVDSADRATLHWGRFVDGVTGELSYARYIEGPPTSRRLIVQYPGLHDDVELRLTAIFCEQVRAAVVSAGLREHYQELALIDWLTGLENRRAFQQRGAALVHEFRNLGMIDIDGLKRCNDVEGHHAGDRLIARTAELLKDAVIERGTVFRIGGDEFIVLTDADGKDAVNGVQAEGDVRFSLGWCSIDGATQLQDAVRHADRAMYADKGGRSKGGA